MDIIVLEKIYNKLMSSPMNLSQLKKKISVQNCIAIQRRACRQSQNVIKLFFKEQEFTFLVNYVVYG